MWPQLGVQGERGLAEVFGLLGMVAYSGEQDFEAAQSLFEQSLQLYQKHGDAWGHALSLFRLGTLAVERNEDRTALTLLEQSMNLFHQLGDSWGKARVSQLLGQLFLGQGNYERSRSYFEQNLQLDEALHFKAGIAIALANLGDLHRYQGDDEPAQQFYEKGLSMCREYGLKVDEGYNLYSLGMLSLHQENYLLARQFFTDYYESNRKLAYKSAIVGLLAGLAAVAAGMNEPERAATLSGASQGISDGRIPPFDQSEFDRHIQIARERLGEERFEVLAAEGRAMSLERAIEFALE